MGYNTTKRLAGFSLPEVLLAVAFFSIIVAAASLFAVSFFENYSFSFEENQSIHEARTGMTRILRDIREARAGADGSWPIVLPGDNEFIFYSDVTNDGFSDRVRYFVDGTTLRRGIIRATLDPIQYLSQNETFSTIASGVDPGEEPIFTYYNGDWLSDTANNPLEYSQRLLYTRYVRIALRINLTDNYGAQPFELISGVQIRGLKDNL